MVIFGPSGSGKSALAAQLVERWHNQNFHARWVADDRIMLEQVGGNLVARAPPTLQGLAERRFAAIEHVAIQKRAILDLAVRLVTPDRLERLPEPAWYNPSSQGVKIPLIQVPNHNTPLAVELVLAQLGGN